MRSKPPWAPRRPFLPLFCLLGATACTTLPGPTRIAIPDSLRAACERPDPAGVATIGDLASFSLRQDAALSICDGRRAAVVAVADAYAPPPPKRHWWQAWDKAR